MMSLIKKLFGKKVAEVQQEPRQYEVPTGLAVRVARLMDQAPQSREAKYQLWRFLADRCPETLTGQWRVELRGGSVWIVEVLA